MTIRQGQTVIAGLSSVVGSTDNTTVSVNGQNKVQAIGLVNKNGNSPKYDWVGTLAQYNALNSYNNDWTYFITDDNVTTNAVQNAIGQIIQVACNSSYIPDGCLPCDGTEYSRNVFGDLWTNYLVSSPARLATCTYAEYSSDVSTYGQCGKFAVDTVNGMFKVPYIKDGSYLTQALSNSELGKSYNESLPNIKGQAGFDYGTASTGPYTVSGAFTSGSSKTGRPNSYDSNSSIGQLKFDASLSSSTYQDNAKVQGDNVRVRYFVVVVDGHINQSMMDWAQWTSEMSNKANLDLANTGRITNCLTHIPQDIKLELNNGTLTLKAGSKVYVPNGAGVFDVVTIANDISTVFDNTLQKIVLVSGDGTSLTHGNVSSQTASGPTQPTLSWGYWYDTSNNIIKKTTDGSSYSGKFSLPICIAIGTNGSVTSIDQVFNGFGYIGSTVFALPGVKGLIPNGRNADGSCKNIEYIVQNVLTRTFTTGAADFKYTIGLMNNGTFDREGYYTLTKDNYLLGPDGNIYTCFEVFNISFDSNIKITYFSPKTTFHALDYNDKETIVSWRNPNYDAKIEIGADASVGSYTPPKDGWIYFQGGTSGASMYYNSAKTTDVLMGGYGSNSSLSSSCFIPVKKGHTYYFGATAVAFRRFFPCKGE